MRAVGIKAVGKPRAISNKSLEFLTQLRVVDHRHGVVVVFVLDRSERGSNNSWHRRPFDCGPQTNRRDNINQSSSLMKHVARKHTWILRSSCRQVTY